MTASLRALLDGIIDYAGLFPPARLPLDAAIRNFTTARAGADAWMLSRFVIPAARLSELSAHHEALTSSSPLALSILGRGGPDAEGFLAGLDRDLGDLELFVERHGDAASVEVCELKLPAGIMEPPSTAIVDELLERAAALVESRSPVPLQLYYEGTYGPDWHRLTTAIIEALAAHRDRHDGSGKARTAGFKIRCGGTDASTIPPVEQIAEVIARCREMKVPFKATAGLHHPVRHLDHALLAKAHGFLNVFCAAALAHARGIDEATLLEVVSDEDARAFVFEEQQFRWRDQAIALYEIEAARRELACSFGSCSLDEPRDDLRALGLA